MSLVRAAIIITLLGLHACSGQNVDHYEGNDQPAAASVRKNQDVSILKQIHRHNEDGSYTYGYEGSDGSFKVETKSRSGQVTGKYGYVDDAGKLRVVEYGADKNGFRPSGEGITVPPATLVEAPRQPDNDDETPPLLPPRSVTVTLRPSSPRKSASRPENPAGVLARRPSTIRDADDGARPARVRAEPTYRTYENVQEPATERGPAIFRPAGQRTGRDHPTSQTRWSGGVLDRLVERYALPAGSGARETHNVSFGL